MCQSGSTLRIISSATKMRRSREASEVQNVSRTIPGRTQVRRRPARTERRLCRPRSARNVSTSMTGVASWPLMLADVARVEQLLHIGNSRQLLDPRTVWRDTSSIPWCGRRVGCHWFAISGLGPGWVFDGDAQSRRSQDLEKLRRCSASAQQYRLRTAFRQRSSRPCGWWSLPSAFFPDDPRVRFNAKRSVLRVPDVWFASRIWSGAARPRHWRTTIRRALESLAWLHLSEGEGNHPPAFGTQTAVLTHAADLLHSPNDQCDEDCPLRGAQPHHHFAVNIGRGFLGVLEGCAVREERGLATMSFLPMVPSRPAQLSANLAERDGSPRCICQCASEAGPHARCSRRRSIGSSRRRA